MNTIRNTRIIPSGLDSERLGKTAHLTNGEESQLAVEPHRFTFISRVGEWGPHTGNTGLASGCVSVWRSVRKWKEGNYDTVTMCSAAFPPACLLSFLPSHPQSAIPDNPGLSPLASKVSRPRCLPSTWLLPSRLWLNHILQWPIPESVPSMHDQTPTADAPTPSSPTPPKNWAQTGFWVSLQLQLSCVISSQPSLAFLFL